MPSSEDEFDSLEAYNPLDFDAIPELNGGPSVNTQITPTQSTFSNILSQESDDGFFGVDDLAFGDPSFLQDLAVSMTQSELREGRIEPPTSRNAATFAALAGPSNSVPLSADSLPSTPIPSEHSSSTPLIRQSPRPVTTSTSLPNMPTHTLSLPTTHIPSTSTAIVSRHSVTPIETPSQTSHENPIASSSTASPAPIVVSASTAKKRKCDEDTTTKDRTERRLRKRQKSKEKEKARTMELVMGYEDGLTCSVCSDLFLCPQISIPCGHTFCAPCITAWLATPVQKHMPTCPTCRTTLVKATPVIANFVMINFVDIHVARLRQEGLKGWEVDGEASKDWENRKMDWDATIAALKKRALPPKPPPFRRSARVQPMHVVPQGFDADSPLVVSSDAEDDPEYDDSGY